VSWTRNIEALPRARLVAIGLKREDQSHVGVIYRRSDQTPVRLLHLAWHHQLRDEDLPKSYNGILIQVLPEELIPTLLGYCERVLSDSALKGVPYGFGYRNELVSDVPTALSPSGFSGYTCATFVLAILRDLNLIDPTQWCGAEGDGAWKTMIIETLQRNGAAQDHVDAVRADAVCPRIQPIHVAAAATFASVPADYDPTIRRGEEIRRELEEPR
jgi:hypothetical protein